MHLFKKGSLVTKEVQVCKHGPSKFSFDLKLSTPLIPLSRFKFAILSDINREPSIFILELPIYESSIPEEEFNVVTFQSGDALFKK